MTSFSTWSSIYIRSTMSQSCSNVSAQYFLSVSVWVSIGLEFHSLIYADTFFNAGSLSGYHRNVNHRVAFYQRSRAWTSTIPKSLLPLKPECFYTIIEPKLKYSKVKFLAFFNSGNHGLELKFFWYTAVQLYISNINLLASWVSESKSDIFNCFCFVVVSLITRTLSRQLSWKSQIGQPALYASVERWNSETNIHYMHHQWNGAPSCWQDWSRSDRVWPGQINRDNSGPVGFATGIHPTNRGQVWEKIFWLVSFVYVDFDLQAVSSIIVHQDSCLALFTRKTGGHALFCTARCGRVSDMIWEAGREELLGKGLRGQRGG